MTMDSLSLHRIRPERPERERRWWGSLMVVEGGKGERSEEKGKEAAVKVERKSMRIQERMQHTRGTLSCWLKQARHPIQCFRMQAASCTGCRWGV
jgi:hypothetical protein